MYFLLLDWNSFIQTLKDLTVSYYRNRAFLSQTAVLLLQFPKVKWELAKTARSLWLPLSEPGSI